MADAVSQRRCICIRGLQHQQECCTTLHTKSHPTNRARCRDGKAGAPVRPRNISDPLRETIFAYDHAPQRRP